MANFLAPSFVLPEASGAADPPRCSICIVIVFGLRLRPSGHGSELSERIGRLGSVGLSLAVIVFERRLRPSEHGSELGERVGRLGFCSIRIVIVFERRLRVLRAQLTRGERISKLGTVGLRSSEHSSR